MGVGPGWWPEVLKLQDAGFCQAPPGKRRLRFRMPCPQYPVGFLQPCDQRTWLHQAGLLSVGN